MMTNLKKSLIIAIIIGTLLLTSQLAMAGMFWNKDYFSTQQLATVKVSMTDAIAQAKTLQSGTVIKAMLEKDNGKLVYEIEFFDNGKEIEVMVNAINGTAISGKD
jgi:uncharacterized membrane protein YkoI